MENGTSPISATAIDFRDRPPTPDIHGFFRGRPRGRSVDSRPNRSVVLFCHRASTNGHARSTDLRSASNSPSVCASFTNATQFLGRGTGQSDNRAVSSRPGR